MRRSRRDSFRESTPWECVYLDTDRVLDLLGFVEANARHPFLFPMLAFAAFTGARRSEVVRSEIEDFDFERETVKIRQKKHDPSSGGGYRHVDLHWRLAGIIQDWFSRHPGGTWTIAWEDGARAGEPLTEKAAYKQLLATLAGSKWEVVSRFHVLRHSFASNLKLHGFDQSIIDKWLGHRTEKMRVRYQHLVNRELKRAGRYTMEINDLPPLRPR